MLKSVKINILILAVATLSGVIWAYASRTNLFATGGFLIPRAFFLGVLLGGVRAVFKKKPVLQNGYAIRHDGGSFLQHWGTATGVFFLLVSGFLLGLFPSDQAIIDHRRSLFYSNLHFVGVLFVVTCGFYWAFDFFFSQNYKIYMPNFNDIFKGTIQKYILRKNWNSEGKYLSSQKSAFLFFALTGFLIFISGAVKTLAYYLHVNEQIMHSATVVHSSATILLSILLLVHVTIVLIAHRPILVSWFTGKLEEDYAKIHHPLWYEELKNTPKKSDFQDGPDNPEDQMNKNL